MEKIGFWKNKATNQSRSLFATKNSQERRKSHLDSDLCSEYMILHFDHPALFSPDSSGRLERIVVIETINCSLEVKCVTKNKIIYALTNPTIKFRKN
ncbi:hypothetical protein A8A01_23185 [Ewingella americana]|nr:hypothetical protein A8A01_23185 [Ewingella americana]